MNFNTFLTTTLLGLLLISFLGLCEGKKNRKRNEDEDRGQQSDDSSSSDRLKLFEGLTDPESSAQAISPATVNPYTNQLLLQNQAALFNNQGLFAGGNGANSAAAAAALGSGNLQNLGGGLFSNQFQPYQFGLSGQGLNGNSFVNAAVGGLNAYQNPLLFGGANIPGISSPDIYSQSAAAAQLYNNPYIGNAAAALGGGGISAGINPLLLRGQTNLQYPIVGGNPYLAAQALLSPYSNYNQLNPYNNFPFASRFGIGVGRSSIGNRQSSNSNNNDE
ncbi:hypothetical protein Ocin01_04013 [Orchesella cincta]|uniref:Uncharacterized protein n=1 Tax=Orchesella cincta TaxID=48709 RepID=A0A1D2NBQ5_ORCCI|nr:hypothetical protein Ocin01_04013 [Orchesella cincta]